MLRTLNLCYSRKQNHVGMIYVIQYSTHLLVNTTKITTCHMGFSLKLECLEANVVVENIMNNMY